MNMAEVAQAAYAAGVKDRTDLGRAVAVAFAESGGNPRAHNPVGRDDSYGLWQINMRGDLGPDRRRRFGISDNAQLFDPAVNAKAMVDISGGGKNWSKDWTTYGGLRYLAFLPAANAAAAGIAAGNPVADAAGGAVDAATEPLRVGVGAVVKAGEWASNRNNWFRVAKVLVGGAMIVGGLSAIGRGYAAKAVAPIVGAVAPAGKAVKAVGGMVKK